MTTVMINKQNPKKKKMKNNQNQTSYKFQTNHFEKWDNLF